VPATTTRSSKLIFHQLIFLKQSTFLRYLCTRVRLTETDHAVYVPVASIPASLHVFGLFALRAEVLAPKQTSENFFSAHLRNVAFCKDSGKTVGLKRSNYSFPVWEASGIFSSFLQTRDQEESSQTNHSHESTSFGDEI
jgi:hypothetical protein